MKAISITIGLTALFLSATVAGYGHPNHHHDSNVESDTAEGEKGQIAYRTVSALPRNQVEISIKGQYRYIVSNGIPDHPTGTFPNAGNPNTIKAQKLVFKVPATPKITNQKGKHFRGMFGVALNGIPFDPGTAETWDGDPLSRSWRYEALTGHLNLGCDNNNAHVQPDGTYHYHGIPVALLNEQSGGKQKMVLLGYAADGFPFYGPYGYLDPKKPRKGLKKVRPSYKLKSGTRPDGPGGKYDGTFTQDFEYVASMGDLDDCNGRFGATPEYPEGIYHYYLTYEFPFVPRKFKGEPDSSFEHKGGPPTRPGGGPPGQGGRRPPGAGGPNGRGHFPPPHPPGMGPLPPGSQFRRPPLPDQRQSTPTNRSDHIKQYNW